MPKDVKQQPSSLGVIGWVIGLLVSVFTPILTAPMSLSLPFTLGGSVSGMFGFAVMAWLFSKRNMSGRKKFYVALAALILGLGAGGWYRALLIAPEHSTPNSGIEVLEFALYCFAGFFLCAVVSYAYWYSGPVLVRIFRRFPIGTG
jgi:hypothetical protein